MSRLLQRVYHLWERIIREARVFPMRWRVFGWKVAWVTFWDGLIPPGKAPQYIQTIENKVDEILMPLVEEYRGRTDQAQPMTGKIPVWCCWWQGVEQMPQIVRMCHERLKQVLPEEKAELHIITLDNYQEYVDLPTHVIKKFNQKIITMTTMSDVLRFALLGKYGGYWLDATVFFTGEIPKEFFSGRFHCQRMASNRPEIDREACRGNWCGFSMAGPKNSIVFQFMSDAFSYWWEHYDTIIDYVLIDYMLWTGFKLIPGIHDVIDEVPDNNEEIFELYQRLNLPYSPQLLAEMTKRNVMHKLTYKMELHEQTPDGQQTLYGHLLEQVYNRYNHKVIPGGISRGDI